MPSIETTATPTTDIHYTDRGTGKPVVLIHGWPVSHKMWEGQINALVDAGHRCIAYDRRGFGDSGRPVGGFDYDTFASDLNDLMTALELRDAALCGFSMGGGEVARYIGTYGTSRVSKAILLCAVTPFLMKTDDNPDGAPESMFDGMVASVKADRITMLAGFFPQFYNWKPGSSTPGEDVIAYSKSLAWIASPQGTQECIVAFGKTDFRKDLEKFDVPTLVVHGDDDNILPIKITGHKSHEMIKGSRYEVLKGAPHGFTATHAEELNTILIDFLKS